MGRDAARRRSQAGLALVLLAAWLPAGLRRGDRLHESGLVLLACDVTALRLHAAASPAPGPGGPAARTARPTGKILLVGLDGADWNIVDPLLARGALPHLARLIKGGTRGRM